MYHELNLYDYTKSEKEILDAVFHNINLRIYSIFASCNYIGKIKGLCGDSVKIACPVDYPSGLGHTLVRQHECITAINAGAEYIDLVVNPINIVNNCKYKIIENLKSIIEICENKKIKLRVMLDYRMFTDKLIFETVKILSRIGVEYISPSTGQFVEDFDDNLIICQQIEKRFDIKTIGNFTRLTQEQYEKIIATEIYGIRLKSFSNLKLVY